MEYIYSALLLHKVGKKVEESRVKAILNAAGVTPDEGRIKVLLAALDGVNIDEAIASANMPLASSADFPSSFFSSFFFSTGPQQIATIPLVSTRILPDALASSILPPSTPASKTLILPSSGV